MIQLAAKLFSRRVRVARTFALCALAAFEFVASAPLLAQNAKIREPVVDPSSVTPGLAERQLERRKQSLRDIRTEQRRVMDEFLRCIDAAKWASNITECERVEREALASIKRAMRGPDASKR